MLLLTIATILALWIYSYQEVCGDVATCKAMRESLRVANERLLDLKYCEEELEGLKRSNALTVEDNIAMYEQLVECECPPERWK